MLHHLAGATIQVAILVIYYCHPHHTPDKAAYCVFTQFRVPENAIKLISVRTKTQ